MLAIVFFLSSCPPHICARCHDVAVARPPHNRNSGPVRCAALQRTSAKNCAEMNGNYVAADALDEMRARRQNTIATHISPRGGRHVLRRARGSMSLLAFDLIQSGLSISLMRARVREQSETDRAGMRKSRKSRMGDKMSVYIRTQIFPQVLLMYGKTCAGACEHTPRCYPALPITQNI